MINISAAWEDPADNAASNRSAGRELRRRLDVRVFVDVPPDERFIWRHERDVRERGRTAESVIDQYRHTVKPMHDRRCEPSKRHADLIVPGGGANRPALAVLAGGFEWAVLALVAALVFPVLGFALLPWRP